MTLEKFPPHYAVPPTPSLRGRKLLEITLGTNAKNTIPIARLYPVIIRIFCLLMSRIAEQEIRWNFYVKFCELNASCRCGRNEYVKVTSSHKPYSRTFPVNNCFN